MVTPHSHSLRSGARASTGARVVVRERKAAALKQKEHAAWIRSTSAEALALVEAARVEAAAAAG